MLSQSLHFQMYDPPSPNIPIVILTALSNASTKIPIGLSNWARTSANVNVVLVQGVPTCPLRWLDLFHSYLLHPITRRLMNKLFSYLFLFILICFHLLKTLWFTMLFVNVCGILKWALATQFNINRCYIVTVGTQPPYQTNTV